jgi:signal transduction histidine kinase
MAGLTRHLPVSRRKPDRPDIATGATGAELDNPPFFRSIRFRLTAWYATALILVIIALAISLHTLLVRALTADAQGRLENAAREVAEGISVAVEQSGSATDPSQLFQVQSPSFDSILLSGLWFQVFDINRQVAQVDSSGALSEPPPDLETAFGDSNVFSVERNTFKTIEVGGEKSLVLVAPFRPEITESVYGPTAGWVIVGEPLGSRDKIIEIVDQILRIFGVTGVALAVWGGWLIAGRALAPVGKITRTADMIANGEGAVSLSRRLDIPDTGDEISRLAATFNTMLDRIEAAFLSQRRFVGDASHELRTPLTSVRGNVDVLLRQLRSDRPIPRDDIVEELGVVQRESARMGRLIEDMLVLARTDASSQAELLKLEPVSLDVLAAEAFRTAHQLATNQELRLVASEPVTLVGDGDRLVQVMIILLDNAIRHTPARGVVELCVDQATDTSENRTCARIQVKDTGAGIAAEHVPHLFERFYRVEDARTRASGGTGLGLSIALAIVRGHQGWIDVDTAVGEGTTFTVWLPLDRTGGGADMGGGGRGRRAAIRRRIDRVRSRRRADPDQPEPPAPGM